MVINWFEVGLRQSVVLNHYSGYQSTVRLYIALVGGKDCYLVELFCYFMLFVAIRDVFQLTQAAAIKQTKSSFSLTLLHWPINQRYFR